MHAAAMPNPAATIETTLIHVPIDHPRTEVVQQSTANVVIVEPRGRAPYMLLMVSVAVSMDEIGKMTGAQRIGPMAQWLQEQIPLVNDMLADGDARDTVLGYLEEYARVDREDGRLPVT